MRSARVSSILVFAFGLTLLPALAIAQLPAPPANTLPSPPKSTLPAARNDALSSEDSSADEQEESVSAKQLREHVADLLHRGDFAEIDRIADRIHQEKTRLPGGGWLISAVTQGLETPKDSTKEEQVDRLKAWVAARPQSITAHVALAKAYIAYAWEARGNGYADKVTDEGWRLFNERIAKAKKVLDDSANMKPMCPEWFSRMQTVALAQDWEKVRTAALFAQAIKFEPDYISFYKSYAQYLLPKWAGEDGDDAALAKQSADAIGGQKGDYVYYEIATVALQAKSGRDGAQFDWARIQSGYRAKDALYKTSNADTNELAFMAWRFQDRSVAREAFLRIGERWTKGIWNKRTRFDQVRDWANKPDAATTAALQ
jgi:hypothetical protein